MMFQSLLNTAEHCSPPPGPQFPFGDGGNVSVPQFALFIALPCGARDSPPGQSGCWVDTEPAELALQWLVSN